MARGRGAAVRGCSRAASAAWPCAICSSIRWKLSSSHSPAGVIRWFADTAAVNRLQTSISTPSFAANRGSSWSRARLGVSRCAAASVLPCRSIWSALNNSERSGSSSTGGLCDEPLVRRRALNWVRCPKIDVLLVTTCTSLIHCDRCDATAPSRRVSLTMSTRRSASVKLDYGGTLIAARINRRAIRPSDATAPRAATRP